MKRRLRLTLALTLALTCTAQAQIKFSFKDAATGLTRDVAAGETITIKATAQDWGGGWYVITGGTNENNYDLKVVNTTKSPISTTVVGTVVKKSTPNAIGIQLCVGGSCTTGTTSLTQTTSIAAESTTNALWDVDFNTVENYGKVETTYAVTTGGKTFTLNIHFEYDDPSGVSTLTAGKCYTDRVIYDLTGKRVTETLHRGFYIVDGHKCFVK